MLFIVRKKKRRTVESSFFCERCAQSLPVVERSCKATDKGWLRPPAGGEKCGRLCAALPRGRRALKPKNGFLDTPSHFVLGPRCVLGKRMRAAEETGGSWREKGDALGNYTLITAGKAPGRVQGGSVCPEIATCLIRGNSLPGRVSEAARTRKRRQPHGRPCARSSP